MIIKIDCPKCETTGSMSLADVIYTGPYKCWKCKALFLINIQNDKLKSCEPLSQEEFDKHLEEQRKKKELLKRQQEIEDVKNRFRK